MIDPKTVGELEHAPIAERLQIIEILLQSLKNVSLCNGNVRVRNGNVGLSNDDATCINGNVSYTNDDATCTNNNVSCTNDNVTCTSLAEIFWSRIGCPIISGQA